MVMKPLCQTTIAKQAKLRETWLFTGTLASSKENTRLSFLSQTELFHLSVSVRPTVMQFVPGRVDEVTFERLTHRAFWARLWKTRLKGGSANQGPQLRAPHPHRR